MLIKELARIVTGAAQTVTGALELIDAQLIDVEYLDIALGPSGTGKTHVAL